MKITCISNDPKTLAEHQLARGQGADYTYSLTPGTRYQVLGMSITEVSLDFLVVDDWRDPVFFPAGLFMPFNAPFPFDWVFSLRTGVQASGVGRWSDPVIAMWGYPELARDPDHVRALLERESGALDVFWRHARAMEDE